MLLGHRQPAGSPVEYQPESMLVHSCHRGCYPAAWDPRLRPAAEHTHKFGSRQQSGLLLGREIGTHVAELVASVSR